LNIILTILRVNVTGIGEDFLVLIISII
jgi:hypothetical protein